MANYKKDTDYTALIEQAAREGNYAGAALLEQARNQKISDWKLDYEPTDKYSNYLPTAGTNPSGGTADSVYTHNASQDDVKGQMNNNSAQWWVAKGMGDTDMMKSLEEANRQLASLLGSGVNFDGARWSGVADMPATMQASMNTGVNPVLPTYDYNAWAVENPAPEFQSAYNAQIDQLMNGLLNREKFSYDAESDPLFQQYRDIYTREGNRSMNDTLAAAASGAGGMSSYAMTAAQQANNYYMAQLGDKIPELQQLAYDMYLNDLNLQRQDVNMLMDKDSMDYNRYRDSMNDWYNDRNFGYNMYRDQMGDYQWGTNFNYNAYRDQVADDRYKTEWEHALEREAYEDEWRNKEWDYGVSRDEIEDYWREKQFNYGVSQDELDNYWRQKQWEYGVSQDQLAEEWRQKEWDYETSLGGWDGGTGGDDVPADDPESENKFWSSVNDLGIGPRNASFILEIADYGGIIENADGTVKWANGWNANNYEEKLRQAKGISAIGFLP